MDLGLQICIIKIRKENIHLIFESNFYGMQTQIYLLLISNIDVTEIVKLVGLAKIGTRKSDIGA